MKSILPKAILFSFAALLSLSEAHALPASFRNLTCRSHDYYALGGNRKTLEVSVSRESSGAYTVNVARAFDVLLPSHEYREQSRVSVSELRGLTCLQAEEDPRIVTCSSGKGAQNYFSLARNERTGITSAFSSEPGSMVRYQTYEASVYGQRQDEYRGFAPESCVMR